MTSPIMQRAQRGLLGAFLLSMAAVFWTGSLESALGYVLLTLSACLPCALWIRSGMPGIPVWPAVAAMSWLYYAVPMLRDHLARALYAPREILWLSVVVSVYLVTGTIVWRLFFKGTTKHSATHTGELLKPQHMVGAVFFGLSLGVLFLVLLGFSFPLGSYFGLARSIMLTASLLACYLLGHARGMGVLRGERWVMAVALLLALVLLTWTSLFLVQGMTELLAAFAGYLLTTKRVPWIPLLASCLVLTIFHAGKAEIRQRYWDPNSGAVGISLSGAPVLLVDWFGTGLTTLTRGDAAALVIDRASLFQLLLNVQRRTPESVPYLNGETYALLPRMLAPRFLVPDKTVSQAAMNLLNIRFGFQTAETTQSTAIGWGLIAEAFANFGWMGVWGIGLVAGAIAGLFTRRSRGAPPLSTGTLIGIVGLVGMMNAEADFAALLSSLSQALVSVLVLTWAFRSVSAKPTPQSYPLLTTGWPAALPRR
jgi:hypothetical protein